jgi:hypothetical protein
VDTLWLALGIERHRATVVLLELVADVSGCVRSLRLAS